MQIVDPVANMTGSIAGGYRIVFTGTGFANMNDADNYNVVLFGAAGAGYVEHANETQMTVLSPPYTKNTVVSVTVQVSIFIIMFACKHYCLIYRSGILTRKR
jgi:hypothetical protein